MSCNEILEEIKINKKILIHRIRKRVFEFLDLIIRKDEFKNYDIHKAIETEENSA